MEEELDDLLPTEEPELLLLLLTRVLLVEELLLPVEFELRVLLLLLERTPAVVERSLVRVVLLLDTLSEELRVELLLRTDELLLLRVEEDVPLLKLEEDGVRLLAETRLRFAVLDLPLWLIA